MTLWKRMLDLDIEAARNRRFVNKLMYGSVILNWLAMAIHIFSPSDASGPRWAAVAAAAAGGAFLVIWSVNPSKEERLRHRAFVGASITNALLLGLALVWLVAPGADRSFIVRLVPVLAVAVATIIGAIAAWLMDR